MFCWKKVGLLEPEEWYLTAGHFENGGTIAVPGRLVGDDGKKIFEPDYDQGVIVKATFSTAGVTAMKLAWRSPAYQARILGFEKPTEVRLIATGSAQPILQMFADEVFFDFDIDNLHMVQTFMPT